MTEMAVPDPTLDGEGSAVAPTYLQLTQARAPLGRALQFWNSDSKDAMTAMGLSDLADVPVRLLSTGQARRARLARVIASDVPLWLLDEPLNGLDADGAGQLAQAIASHRAEGGAVLAASHQPLGGGWRQLELGR